MDEWCTTSIAWKRDSEDRIRGITMRVQRPKNSWLRLTQTFEIEKGLSLTCYANILDRD